MLTVLKNSQFTRNVITLVSGQGAAQIITILATPIIARMYVPEDFGVVSLLIAITTILTVPATCRFELASILPTEDSKALLLISLAFGTATVSCFLLLLLIGAIQFSGFIPEWLQVLGTWIYVLPLAVFLTANLNIIESWATRKKQYKSMAASSLGQAVTTTSSRIIFGGFNGSSVWGLVTGYILGFLCKYIIQFRYSPIPVTTAKAISNVSVFKSAIVEYRDFPIYNTTTGLIRRFAQNIPVIMFGIFFGPAVVGLYAMANRLFKMPVTMLSTAIRRVYLQKLTELNNAGVQLRASYLKVTLSLAAACLLPTIILSMIGGYICILFLGEQWQSAGRFFEILTPWLFTTIVASPAVAIVIVCRKQHIWLRYNIVNTILQLAGFVVSHNLWANAEYTLMVFVGIGMAANIFMAIYAYFVATAHHSLRNL